MSWFTDKVEHPFVAAIEGLTTNPAITANPQASAAVTTAKAQAVAIAAAGTTAASTVLTASQPIANPAIDALGGGLEAAADAYLTSAIGPLGESIAAPIVHVVIDLGEEKAHTLIAQLFARARVQVAAAAAKTAAA